MQQVEGEFQVSFLRMSKMTESIKERKGLVTTMDGLKLGHDLCHKSKHLQIKIKYVFYRLQCECKSFLHILGRVVTKSEYGLNTEYIRF